MKIYRSQRHIFFMKRVSNQGRETIVSLHDKQKVLDDKFVNSHLWLSSRGKQILALSSHFYFLLMECDVYSSAQIMALKTNKKVTPFLRHFEPSRKSLEQLSTSITDRVDACAGVFTQGGVVARRFQDQTNLLTY